MQQQQQQNSFQNSPFQGYRVKESHVLARHHNIKYYYKLRKLDLILALENNNIDIKELNIILSNTNTKKITKSQKNITSDNLVPIPQEPISIVDKIIKLMDDSYPFKPATPQQVCKPWKTLTENVKRYLERKKQLEQVSELDNIIQFTVKIFTILSLKALP